MDEVAVDAPARRRAWRRALERVVDAVDDALDAGRRAVDGRERLDERVLAAAASRGRAARSRRRCRRPLRTLAAIACGVAAVLDEHVRTASSRRARCRRRRASVRPAIAVPVPGKFFSCDSFGFSCSADARRGSRRSTSPTAATGHGRRLTKRAQRPQAPSSGWPWSTKRFGITRTLLIRSPSTASSAGSSVIAAITETAGISMPPMPDRADERQRQDDQREQADRDGRAGDDHRAPGVRHRLDERGLDVLAFTQLVAEAEDHQQRVVDRDAEADERDQELHDDRDVRDVGQDPDERERVEDRRRPRRRSASAPPAASRRRRGGSRARRGRRPSPRGGRPARRCRRACSPPRAGRGP